MQTLRRIKRDTNMGQGMYRTMYSTGCAVPNFYGLPRIHKTGIPLRSIVSGRGSVTYGVAIVLTMIIGPLIGKSPDHIQSTRDFVNRVREVTLLPGECLNSCDASALFTSVPIDPTLNIIKDPWKRMIPCMTGVYCQYRTSLNFWGCVCTIHTSLSKINSKNRLKEWPWGHQSSL